MGCFKRCADQIIKRCVPEEEIGEIIKGCHSSLYGGHDRATRTAAKVLQSVFFWPNIFKDFHVFVKTYDRCQRVGNISMKQEIPLNNIIEARLFDVRGINFMGPFPPSNGNLYILVAVDYVSK